MSMIRVHLYQNVSENNLVISMIPTFVTWLLCLSTIWLHYTKTDGTWLETWGNRLVFPNFEKIPNWNFCEYFYFNNVYDTNYKHIHCNGFCQTYTVQWYFLTKNMINLEIKPFKTLHHSNYSSMIESYYTKCRNTK